MTNPDGHTAPTRKQLIQALSEALSMMRSVGFDDSCDRATKRLWRSENKRLADVLARAKEQTP